MATHVFRLPDLGEGLTEAELVQWLVNVGDEIVIDQAIAEVETAKSTVELPSPFAGTVLALHGQSGETLLVGVPVLEVGPAHATTNTPVASTGNLLEPEPVSAVGEPTASSVDLDAYRAEEQAGSGNVLIGYGTTGRGGAVRRRPRAAGAPPVQLAPAASGSPTPGIRPAVRSPLVRRLARDLGVDLAAIVSTGSDGAVTRGDVLRAAMVEPEVVSSAAPTFAATVAGEPESAEGLAVVSRERMSMLRRTVSAKLSRSRSEIPEATVWVDVDATKLWELRPGMAVGGSRPPSFTAILARYVLLALAEYPLLAGRLSSDGNELIQFDGVNLGVAADTERGLLVPVIARADRLTITELDISLRALAGEAREGGLPPERLRGSTFTLNNYGSFGIDGSAAIINHPEVAILGVGRVLERPWVIQGELAVRRIVQLSLVFDHRVCDGGYAAGFLRHIVDAIESPLAAYGRI